MARRAVLEPSTPLLAALAPDVVRPSGHTAVMASRAPISPDDLDYFPTPPWAARAGGELIRRLDARPGLVCWEPACGEGHMVYGLTDYFDRVVASDIYPYGAGLVFDFIGHEAAPCAGWPTCDWIVSNPPFVQGERFIRAAMQRARRGVAMLLRLAFLESIARYRLLYQDCPLTLVAPFAERVPMVKGRYDPEASSATAYAWFIFDHAVDALAFPRVMPIPPGTKARLTGPDDARLWGRAA